MTNYTKTTDFAAKDALLTGNPSKIVKGTEINTEFTNIETAVNSKYDASTTVPVSAGGTGSTTASAALTALGAAPTASPTFTGKIQGDFSNGVLASRVNFQSSTVNGTTAISVIPNGTSTQTQVALYSDSAQTAGNLGDLVLNNSEFRIRTVNVGAGTAVPMTFYTNGSERVRIDTTGAVGLSGANYGSSGQVLTSAGSGSAPTWSDAPSGLGVSQTWQDMTGVGGRASGATITNGTSKPISVMITFTSTVSGSTMGMQITVAGNIIGPTTVMSANTTGYIGRDTFTVPAGATYKIDLTNCSINKWWELR